MAAPELSQCIPDDLKGPLPVGSRAKDEQIISMCECRALGWTFTPIGHAHGVSKSAAISAVRKVIEADVNESGEPEGAVRAAYEPKGEE